MAKQTVHRKGYKRKGYTRKDGVKVRPTYVKSTKYTTQKKKPIKVLIAHDNRLGYSTKKVHKFADRISKNREFKVIIDKKY